MDARLPDALCQSVVAILPPQAPPGERGGRPPIEHAVVLKVMWFVLTAGCRWKDVPAELECCGETARQRLKRGEQAGEWIALQQRLLAQLRRLDVLELEVVLVDSTHVRAFGGGAKSGPCPVDRRKLGIKFTLQTDLRGTPLALRSAPANRSDQREILPIVEQYPAVGGKPGSPRRRPRYLLADAGHDSQSTRATLQSRGIDCHIRRRKARHGSGLGRFRWPVKRTFSWLKDYVDYEFVTICTPQSSTPGSTWRSSQSASESFNPST